MNTERADGRFRLDEWTVDPAIDEIRSPSARQKLEPRTMRLLLCLAKAGTGVVSTEKLLDEVWQGVVVGPNSVYQAVSNLRRLLGDTDATPRLIATVPRKGYRLLVAPQWLDEGSGTAPDLEHEPTGVVETGTHSRRRSADRFWVTRHPWMSGIVLGLAGLALVAAGYRYFGGRADASPSIAVLPFVDLTPDGGQQAFGDGLAEELSNWLAQLPSMRVVARTSAFSFRGKEQDVRDIGKALSASHVLEGSIRRAGDRIRVTAQLIDAKSGYHVWSQSLDRPFSDVISIQDEIARAVAQALELRLSSVEVRRFGARTPEGARAFELYLLGRQANYERSPEGNAKALSFFQQAIELDPEFALAHAARSSTLLEQIAIMNADAGTILPEALAEAETALRFGPELPEPYAARAAVLAAREDHEGALKDLARALELNPNSLPALVAQGTLLRSLGRPREAVASAQRAVALDPIDWLRQADLCVAERDSGQYETAAQACARARELEGDGPWAKIDTAWLEFLQGRIDSAIGWLEQAEKFRPRDPWIVDTTVGWLQLLGLHDAAKRKRGPQPDLVSQGIDVYLNEGADALPAWLEGSGRKEPDSAIALFNLAWLHWLARDVDGARAYTLKAQSAPDFTPALIDGPDVLQLGRSAGVNLIAIARAQGRLDEAQVLSARVEASLDAAEKHGLRGPGLALTRAELAALAGRDDDAVALLREAYEAGWRGLVWIEHEPIWSRVRSRADYQALSKLINEDLARMRAALQPDPSLT